MARSETRPVVTLRSTAGTGRSYVTRKNRRNDPDRLELRKFDSAVGSTRAVPRGPLTVRKRLRTQGPVTLYATAVRGEEGTHR